VRSVKVRADRDEQARVRTANRPQPLDPVGLLLAVVGVVLLLVTHQPEWSGVLVLAASATALARPRGRGPYWAVAGLTVAGLGWLAALGWATLADGPWTTTDELAWGRQPAPLVLAGAVALLLRRRSRLAADEVEQARGQAQETAVRDPLTGLLNPKGLAMLAGPILESARRRGDAVYCVVVDVDGLTTENAEQGERAGDDVLLTVSDVLSRCTRGTDAVARWGDDEFVVVGPGTGLPPLEIERRVRALCRIGHSVDRTGPQPRITAGGAILEPWDDGDVESLLRNAGRDMHVRRALRREAVLPARRSTRRDADRTDRRPHSQP